jgi:hypothetical protein
MKNPKKLLITISLAIVCIFCFGTTGCEQPVEEEINVAVEAVINTATMLYASAIAYSSTLDLDSLFNNDGCPEISLKGDFGDRTLRISYADNCTVNSLNLSGEFFGSWSFALGEGVSIDLSLDGFTVTDYTVSGYISLHANALQGPLLTLDGELTINDQTLSVSDMTATVDLNQTLLEPEDDTYTLNGSGTYSFESCNYAVTFTDVVTGPLCYMPVSGSMILKRSNRLFPATIDFGDGTCDMLFTVTVALRTVKKNLIDWIEGLNQ